MKNNHMPEKDLGICQRCKKNKATIQFAEGSLALSHGFVEYLCEDCYKKMQREHPLWKVAVDERNSEVKQAIEEKFALLIYDFDKEKDIRMIEKREKELLQKLGLEK